jgi:hypothetical protein
MLMAAVHASPAPATTEVASSDQATDATPLDYDTELKKHHKHDDNDNHLSKHLYHSSPATSERHREERLKENKMRAKKFSKSLLKSIHNQKKASKAAKERQDEAAKNKYKYHHSIVKAHSKSAKKSAKDYKKASKAAKKRQDQANKNKVKYHSQQAKSRNKTCKKEDKYC